MAAITEQRLKHIVCFRQGYSPTDLVIVKHPKQSQGWYAVNETAKKAFEIFAEIEQVEEVPIWTVPGFAKYHPSK